MNNVYKFVTWDVPELETLSSTHVFKCMEKLNNGEKLTREEKDNFFAEGGFIRSRGWAFDFRPHMNLYLVKDKIYGWREIYGFDKTSIRATYGCPSHILRIVEIPKD